MPVQIGFFLLGLQVKKTKFFSSIHSLAIMVGMLGGGLVAYICYMVSTIDFFNFSSSSS
jgi:hypothetical protein